MQDEGVLSKMWDKYNILFAFKNEMNKYGYSLKDLYCIQLQLSLLKELIEVESVNVLNEMLKKTYYRLLRHIDKGIEYLPDIVLNPENWVLNGIEKDKNAWLDKDCLIFTCRTNCAVFSKISRKSQGYKYVDNKFQ